MVLPYQPHGRQSPSTLLAKAEAAPSFPVADEHQFGLFPVAGLGPYQTTELIGKYTLSNFRVVVQRDDGHTFLLAGVREMAEGFSILAPYLSVEAGVAAKMLVDYSKGEHFKVPEDDIVKFAAGSRVKLSYHSDGFAQFSSEHQGTIRSGRSENGDIKGVGVLTNPLWMPIPTGPSCCLLAWGLDEFERPKLPLRKRDLLARPSEVLDFKDDRVDGTPAYALEFWVFRADAWMSVREDLGGKYLDAAIPIDNPRVLARLRVPAFKRRDYLLGVTTRRLRVQFVTPGWQLAGPSQMIDSTRGEALIAAYPAEHLGAPPTLSLDYGSKTSESGS
jgi:hypothetical protein